MTLPGTRLSAQVRGGTQLVADIFERGIGEHPADWHMLQPLWRADLDDRKTGSGAQTRPEPVGLGQSG
jgi:KDO2-lipid IV(A) lauroyltransferase